nr:substrate-binding domain-containing protein [Halovivax sp.]
MDRRQLLKGAGGIAAATTFAGCLGRILGGGDEGARLWHDTSSAEEEDLERFIEQFAEETGHELLDESVGDMHEQIETATPAGDAPHTWAWAHDWVGRFAVRDDPEILYDGSDDISVDLDTYSGAAQEAITWEGGVYGLPFGSETVTLFYNRELVDEPPETVAEMEEIMEEHHDPEAGTYGLSYNIDSYFCSAWLHAFGGYLYDAEADELGHELDETVQGLEVLDEIFWEYIPEDPEYEAQTTVFNDGNAPFAINGPWELGGFRENLDVGVATLPTIEGNEPNPYTGVQMWYFGSELSDASEEEFEAILDWTEWYTTTEEVVTTNADRHGMIPVHVDHAEADDIDPAVQMFAETVDMGTPMPAHPKMDDVWEPTEDALINVFNGDQDPREALEDAAERIRDAWA